MDIFNLRCDLDLESSNKKNLQDILTYDAVLSYQVWTQMDQHFKRCKRKTSLKKIIIQALAGTLTLMIVNIFFCKILHLMILHHHTKIG